MSAALLVAALIAGDIAEVPRPVPCAPFVILENAWLASGGGLSAPYPAEPDPRSDLFQRMTARGVWIPAYDAARMAREAGGKYWIVLTYGPCFVGAFVVPYDSTPT